MSSELSDMFVTANVTAKIDSPTGETWRLLCAANRDSAADCDRVEVCCSET